MGTVNAFYVRGNGDAVASAIRKAFPDETIEFGQEFSGAMRDVEAYEPPKDELAKLSSALGTDVIWVSYQSAVDAFQFYHWQNGSLLRCLVFGCYGDQERTWEQVEGQPEPWEQSVFFDQEHLEFMLREIARNDEEKREFERIWRDRELVPGRSEPSIDARGVGWKIAEYYRFPGWGEDEGLRPKKEVRSEQEAGCIKERKTAGAMVMQWLRKIFCGGN